MLSRLARAVRCGPGLAPLAQLLPPQARGHCDSTPLPNAKPVKLVFVDKRGGERAVAGLEGDNLVGLAHKHSIELEGACACSLACSTCHVILEPQQYDALEAPGEEEEDLLDLAFGLTPTCVWRVRAACSP